VAAVMEFHLLGPLLVRRDGAVVPVPAGQQRALLAALLLNAGRVVPADELAEALWGSEPPRSMRASLQNCVMRLRRSLADDGHSRIATEPDGYLIHVGDGELDVDRFESSLAAAREAMRAGSWADAADRLRAALSLWRGEPLRGVASDLLALREAPRLAEMRLQALEARIEADLHLGRHAEAIVELRKLAAAHPLRERLHGLLMLALYRDGQHAGALAAYQAARSVLLSELGAEPGHQLRQLQQQILAADPVLAAPDPAAAANGRPAPAGTQPGPPAPVVPAPVVPRQLPGAVAHFTGRVAELAALASMARSAAGTSQAVVISAIAGTAGVGKTALAVHWAHQAAGQFPDGQLYVNLRGYDPGQPMPAEDALSGFLHALGVPGQNIPADVDERAALYRSLLAGRRMLVMLDNAGSVEQVRPLLPAAIGCAAVVTSRDALAGLVARDGACRLDLDLLPLPDAVDLLAALTGGRAAADPGAAAALAARCAGLPLALRVAAELAATRPAASLADLAAELADHQRRLDLLDADGDPRTAVRAVFSWSYRHLDPETARGFRLLGLHPGTEFDGYAAAALMGTTLERACHLLEVLARGYLIHPVGADRYGLHDLLRAYAAEQAAQHDPEPQRRAALTRLFDYYLFTAAEAMDALVPAEHHGRTRFPRPATPTPPVTDQPAQARAWLDAERATLILVAAYTADQGWPSYTTHLAVTLFRYLEGGGHYPETVAICVHARRAARRTGDRAAEATAVNNLSVVGLRQGRYREATSQLTQALALYRETGDQTGQARALGNLGLVDYQQGHYQQATGHHQQALALYRQLGNRAGEATTLNNIGLIELRQGRYQPAAGHFRQVLALGQQTGNPTTQATALANLGLVGLRQGHYQRATSDLQRALLLCRQIGDPTGEAEALSSLGTADRQQGRHEQATSQLTQALGLYRETGNVPGEAEALNGLGEVSLASSRPGDALDQHTTALRLAGQIGDKYEEARALAGLARAYDAVGDLGMGRRHWQQALTRYTDLGAPESDQIRAQLSGAGQMK
jgi:DNA-binding SARP family transcriptional activator/Tfp pilus assembly protein PilF